MYTNQEKREIERVLTAFKPYIEQADYEIGRAHV